VLEAGLDDGLSLWKAMAMGQSLHMTDDLEGLACCSAGLMGFRIEKALEGAQNCNESYNIPASNGA